MKSIFKSITNNIIRLKKKDTVLSILMIFIFLIVIVLLFWVYKIYFKMTIEEGFFQSLIESTRIYCDSLSDNLKIQLENTSQKDMENNEYLINKLLTKTVLNESVSDLSFYLSEFANNYCNKTDCSGIPQKKIDDISKNITDIGETLSFIKNKSKEVIDDFNNVKKFHKMTFDCSNGLCN